MREPFARVGVPRLNQWSHGEGFGVIDRDRDRDFAAYVAARGQRLVRSAVLLGCSVPDYARWPGGPVVAVIVVVVWLRSRGARRLTI